MKIHFLSEYPELADACAAWAYGLWGVQTKGVLSEAVGRFREGSQKDALPLTLVAMQEGRPMGMVSLWKSDFPLRSKLSPWLASLYVHPEHRRRGHGKALVKRLEDEARRLGYKELYLKTEHSKNFYEQLGWLVFDIIPGTIPASFLMCSSRDFI